MGTMVRPGQRDQICRSAIRIGARVQPAEPPITIKARLHSDAWRTSQVVLTVSNIELLQVTKGGRVEDREGEH